MDNLEAQLVIEKADIVIRYLLSIGVERQTAEDLAVNKGSARDTRFQSEFARIYLDVCQGQELTEDTPIFGGLVLSGTAEELLELLDHHMCRPVHWG